MGYTMANSLPTLAGLVADAALSVGCRLGHEGFSHDEVAMERAALAHPPSTLKARVKPAEAGLQLRAASRAFDALNMAVILVEATGRIVFASGRAEALLSGHTGLTRDGIHIGGAGTPALRRLRGAIAQCAGTTAPRVVAPVEVAAANGRRPLRVTFTPIGRSPIELERAHADLAEPIALLLIHDHEQQLSTMRQRLCAHFGLTAAEVGVVMEVIQGGSRDDVARRLGVSVATVRTHLARTFQKTGVRRQAELVRLALDHDPQWQSRGD
jgi:DNA-binding CsgD family transcriptional regulator